MFKPGVVYPRDEVGEFIEAAGVVVEVDELLGDAVKVTIRAATGDRLSGYYERRHERMPWPAVGDLAVLHLYRAGGGWYPDDRVVSFHKTIVERV